MARTLEELRAITRRYADMVGSEFRSDSDVNEAVNTAWGELYDMLVSLYDDFFEAETDILVVSGDGTYPLEDVDGPKVGKIRGASVMLSSEEGDEQPIDPFQWSERALVTGQRARISRAVGPTFQYCVRGAKLILRPLPSGNETLRLFYIPQCPTLVAPPVDPDVLGDDEIDTLPFVVQPSWEDFIPQRAAAELLMEEESPTAALRLKLADAVKQRIEADAAPRDADAPHEAVRRRSEDD